MEGIDISVFSGAAFKIRAAPRTCPSYDDVASVTTMTTATAAGYVMRNAGVSTSSCASHNAGLYSDTNTEGSRSVSAGSTCFSAQGSLSSDNAEVVAAQHSPTPCPRSCPPILPTKKRIESVEKFDYPSIPSQVPRKAKVVVYSAVVESNVPEPEAKLPIAHAQQPPVHPPRTRSSSARQAVDYDMQVGVGELVESVPLGRLASASGRSASTSASTVASSAPQYPQQTFAAYDCSDSETESVAPPRSNTTSSSTSRGLQYSPSKDSSRSSEEKGFVLREADLRLPDIAGEGRNGSKSAKSAKSAASRHAQEKELYRQAAREAGWVAVKKEKTPLGGRRTYSELDTSASIDSLAKNVAADVEHEEEVVHPDKVVQRLYPRPGFLERKQKELCALHVDKDLEEMQKPRPRSRSGGVTNFDRPLNKRVHGYVGFDDPAAADCTFKPKLCQHDYTDRDNYNKMVGPVWERLTKPPPEVVARTKPLNRGPRGRK